MKIKDLKEERIYKIKYGLGSGRTHSTFVKFIRKEKTISSIFSKYTYWFYWYEFKFKHDQPDTEIASIRLATKKEINQLAVDEL